MIEAATHSGFLAVFEPYLRSLVRRSFRSVWVSADPLPPSGFVAAANHTSWWDGFVPFVTQRRLAPDRPFGVMMDEKQLRRFPMFRWGGAFSVDASDARKAVLSVRHGASLARNGAAVWIFPEGRMSPQQLLTFKPGFVHAARAAGVPIVPVALRFLMLEAQRPDAFISFGRPIDSGDEDAALRTRAVVGELLAEIDRAAASGEFEARFSPLFPRATGVDDIVAKVAQASSKWL